MAVSVVNEFAHSVHFVGKNILRELDLSSQYRLTSTSTFSTLSQNAILGQDF